jgi:transmembrane sensor
MTGGAPLSPGKDAASIEECAADWLQRRRYWQGWSEEDQKALDAWIAESIDHAVAFWRLESTLDRAERLSTLQPQGMRRPVDTASRALFGKSFRITAALVTVTIAALAAYAMWPVLQKSKGQIYATGLGGRTTIQLTDGSSIELNTDTRIRADVSAGRRYVSVEKGEAFFDIVHDARHPFTVDVDGHRITDLGTKFSIREEAGRVEVTLLQGRASIVSVRPNTQHHAAVLTPGDVAIATADTLSIEQKPKPTLAKELSWRRGLLVFDGARLKDVAAELNRYSRQKIVVSDEQVGKLTIDASVPTDDIRAFTRVARDVFGLRVQDKGDEILISR